MEIKIRVNPETSKLVQEACIDHGIGWGIAQRIKINHLEAPYIYISDDYSGTKIQSKQPYLMFSTDSNTFAKDASVEMTSEEFITKLKNGELK